MMQMSCILQVLLTVSQLHPWAVYPAQKGKLRTSCFTLDWHYAFFLLTSPYTLSSKYWSQLFWEREWGGCWQKASNDMRFSSIQFYLYSVKSRQKFSQDIFHTDTHIHIEQVYTVLFHVHIPNGKDLQICNNSTWGEISFNRANGQYDTLISSRSDKLVDSWNALPQDNSITCEEKPACAH